MAATVALREALNKGISSGNFVDTKIVLYSCRDSSCRIYRPKALYANSHVLKSVAYFRDLLFGDFAESQSKDFSDPIDEEESAEDYGYLSDSDLEDEDDEDYEDEDDKDDEVGKITSPSGSGRVNQSGPPVILDNVKTICKEHVVRGKVVKIPDVAFATFQAFLLHLYTGAVEFGPFGSKENRKSRSGEPNDDTSDDKIPRPSPKSIYRLADKYDVPALKALALNHIRGELAKCDIVEESFSKFASKYGEISDLYAEYLVYSWVQGSTAEKIHVGIAEKVSDFAKGDFEHAADTLSMIWEIASKDGDITNPESSTSPSTPVVTSPAHWASVKMALIKSIRSGVFFDRKYWARQFKTADVLKPIYFSSIIMDDERHRLASLVTFPWVQNTFVGDPEGDVSAESDCEGVKGELPNTEEGGEEEVRPVLKRGSLSAWKSLFFYRCTDEISFAPLRSQGVDTRLNYIREHTTPAAPPPCSPKSIYVLANLLDIPLLRERAFTDIKSKVTGDNIVDEVFSRITADHRELMETQCDLLISNFKNPKTIALVKENIQHISDGFSSHRASALNLVLEKAVQIKKQGVGLGVKLRCVYTGCQWNTNPVSVGSAIGVYHHHSNRSYTMRCTGCGHNRTNNLSSSSKSGTIYGW